MAEYFIRGEMYIYAVILYVITSRACSFARSSTADTTFSWQPTTTVRTTSAVCSKSSCAICPTRCSAASSTLPSSPQQVRHVHRWPWRHSLLTSYFLIYRVLEAQAQGVHVFRFLLDAHPTISLWFFACEWIYKNQSTSWLYLTRRRTKTIPQYFNQTFTVPMKHKWKTLKQT